MPKKIDSFKIKNSFIIPYGFYKTFTIIVSNENNRLLSLKSNFFACLTETSRVRFFCNLKCQSTIQRKKRKCRGSFDRSSRVEEGF